MRTNCYTGSTLAPDTPMRRFLVLLLIAFLAVPAFAQEGKRPRPANLEPLPEAPAPPRVPAGDASLEPEVTIKQKEGAKVEEYRVRGKLYAMKVTPAVGPPYYLIDDRGDGNFIRRDNLDGGLRVPQWVILSF